jgi:hypothetical protein
MENVELLVQQAKSSTHKDAKQAELNPNRSERAIRNKGEGTGKSSGGHHHGFGFVMVILIVLISE